MSITCLSKRLLLGYGLRRSQKEESLKWRKKSDDRSEEGKLSSNLKKIFLSSQERKIHDTREYKLVSEHWWLFRYMYLPPPPPPNQDMLGNIQYFGPFFIFFFVIVHAEGQKRLNLVVSHENELR